MATVAEPSYRQRVFYQAGLLGGVCFLVSMLLIIGNLETADVIRARVAEDKLAMLGQVLPHSLYNNNPVQEAQIIHDSNFFSEPVTVMVGKKNGVVTATALQLSTQGWGGKIQFIMGIDNTGEILGVRVITHTETPGLADKIEIEKDSWITRFNGKSLANTQAKNWAVKKDQGEFDQFTGATITPRAMVKGVYQGMLFYQQWQQRYLKTTEPKTTKQPQSKQQLNKENGT